MGVVIALILSIAIILVTLKVLSRKAQNQPPHLPKNKVVGYAELIGYEEKKIEWAVEAERKKAERQRETAEAVALMSPEEKQLHEDKLRIKNLSETLSKERRKAASYAARGLNSKMICPHCQEKGTVKTEKVTQKKGISGGKATGALLTGGISLLATGLSRKEDVTKAHCVNCSSTWYF